MEREAKRKAAAASAGSPDGPPAKRLKGPGLDDATGQTSEQVIEVGLRFLDHMRNAKDKSGRHIATDFLTLPDPNVYPDYYHQIRLPIALDTIEDKLVQGGYPSLVELEADHKRMIANAKAYNERTSSVYDDAERMRKTSYNFMSKHNPAYKDKDYAAVPTPVPDGPRNGVPNRPVQLNGASQRRAPAQQQPSKTATPVPNGTNVPAAAVVGEDAGFKGMTLTQAQDKIINDLVQYRDPNADLQIYTPFVNLPPRNLKDYYETIAKPTSLGSVRKQVRGVVGKSGPTWNTHLNTWNKFEEEVSLIWKNAQEYNEDESEMYNLAGEFKEHFEEMLAAAKALVRDPPPQTIKLKMGGGGGPTPAPGPSIKLRLNAGTKASPAPGSGTSTPAARKSATPGVIVDNEALQRQQRHVQAGMNGGQRPASSSMQSGAAPRNPFSRSDSSGTPIPSITQYAADRARSGGAGSPPITNGVKSETMANSHSPALNGVRPISAGQSNGHAPQTQQLALAPMLPPSSMMRPPSGSPLPHQTYGHPPQPPQGYHPPPPSYYAPPPLVGLENKYRPPGKTASSALLPTVTIRSHPGLNLPRPFKLAIPASNTLTQQSVTISLPAPHSFIQILPQLASALLGRAHRVFVTVNGQRMVEVVRQGGEKEGNDRSGPLYEGRLNTGVNRVEVEVVATQSGKKPATGGAGSGDGVELERCTVYVNLMRG